MSLHDEIEKLAYELYEKGGRAGGREKEDWFEAERIILARNALGAKPEKKKATRANPRQKPSSGAKAKRAKA
ncbi:MAG: DUF2934 domain-containing protein [Thermodesulfobacteriota bacterium]